MQIVINGEEREIPDGLTLRGLLEHLKLESGRVAIERNREIVKRERWATLPVEPGDQLEIVHFVGGG